MMKTCFSVLLLVPQIALVGCGSGASNSGAMTPHGPHRVIAAAEIQQAAAAASILVVLDNEGSYWAVRSSQIGAVGDNSITLPAGTVVAIAGAPEATEEFSVNEDGVARRLAASLSQSGSGGSFSFTQDREGHLLEAGTTQHLPATKIVWVSKIVAPRVAAGAPNGGSCPPGRVDGCQWIEVEDSRFKAIEPSVLEFKPGGKLVQYAHGDKFENGTWSQEGDQVYFEMNEKSMEFHGKIDGDRLVGNGHSRRGEDFRWLLKRGVR
jgi:hypothetical protein